VSLHVGDTFCETCEIPIRCYVRLAEGWAADCGCMADPEDERDDDTPDPPPVRWTPRPSARLKVKGQ